ncbi:uridine kinase family protein [Streptomyces cacaoi]|uniref:uridine kinase family protein n=1 Tax=Streptomyces cacaoi TaxID=1898 RepID=UPI002602F9EB|nr:hypothetical protein [Streptomyces cacaoi]
MPSFTSLEAFARLVPRLAPSCGPVRLVGVDGYAGSGKTTLAGRLAGLCGGAPVVHLDDIAEHGALFDWTERFVTEVLTPLERGESARYGVYDWVKRTRERTSVVCPAPVVLVEGVGAGRAALRSSLTCLLWMDVPRATAWRRGRERDGAAQAEFWAGWMPAERAHFAADPSRPFADFLVRETVTSGRETGSRPARQEGGAAVPEGPFGEFPVPGYEVFEGPGRAAGGPVDLTLRITSGS